MHNTMVVRGLGEALTSAQGSTRVAPFLQEGSYMRVLSIAFAVPFSGFRCSCAVYGVRWTRYELQGLAMWGYHQAHIGTEAQLLCALYWPISPSMCSVVICDGLRSYHPHPSRLGARCDTFLC